MLLLLKFTIQVHLQLNFTECKKEKLEELWQIY